jgi:hypothetical protein
VKDFTLQGDLNQMAIQKRFLKKQLFEVGQVDVYPTIRYEDIKQALILLYFNRVEGWWNYKSELLKFEICTEDEFKSSLKRRD